MMETLLVQEPFVYIPEETIREALKAILGTCIYRLFDSIRRIIAFSHHLTSLTLLLFQSIQT
jgi:hypothetical protein